MDDPNITVREARLDDSEIIARFNEAMALETEGVRLESATIRAGVASVFADPSRGRYFVAERGGEVAGVLLITYEWSDWRNGTFIWLQSVYVDPSHRRCGVFSGLFRRVERLAASPGRCGLRLYMDSRNEPARRTYERLGLAHGHYIVFESRDRLRHR